MKLIKTKIDGPKKLKTTIFKDSRGFFKEVYRKKIIGKLDFPFDIMSYSKKNVLRGMHIQTKKPQAKIITVTHGKILDVAVDLRKNSKNFGKWVGEIISDKNKRQLWIPEGFAHGFITLSDSADVIYKTNNYYNKDSEQCLVWDDDSVNIDWPIHNDLIISKKDKFGKNLLELDL